MNKYKYNIYQYLKSIKYDYSTNPNNVFKQLLESQHWSKEEIVNFQLVKLNKLLLDSQNSSEYYNKLLANIDLPIKNLADFCNKIPFITKDIIKTQSDQLRTKYFTPDFKHQTSGSSGDPVTIYASGITESYRKAGHLRFLNWWGVKPYDKYIRIVGRRATKNNRTVKEKIMKNLRLRYDINVFDLNNWSIFQYHKDIRSFKPVYIRGYKSALLQFAELMEKYDLFFDNFKFKVATVTAEVLLENERKYIEKILGCKVANEYGSADAGQIAFECPNGSMHIFEEAVYLNTDEDNNVYVTELHNNSMPLINYRNDDKVILAKYYCTCGMNSRIISQIEGRNDDILIKPNGEKLNQNVFVYVVMELNDIGLDNSILKWKIIQNKNDFQIFIVPKINYNDNVEKYIIKRLKEEIGEDITVKFNLVDSIPRDRSGKLRLFTRIG